MSEVTLYHGDCLKVMKDLEDGSVDAVITDPPYGIGSNNIIPGGPSKFHKCELINYDKANWDIRQPKAIQNLVALNCRLVIFGANYYADILPISRGWVVWNKHTNGNFGDGELIYTDKDCALKIFDYVWSGMIKQKPEKRFHPTQKPLALMKWILENYTSSGDTIFDPFMGSGTTGVACVQTGRNFIGIEIDKGYFEIAEKRIKEAQMQLRFNI